MLMIDKKLTKKYHDQSWYFLSWLQQPEAVLITKSMYGHTNKIGDALTAQPSLAMRNQTT